MPVFTVFTMENCPDCKNAKDLLNRKKMVIEERTDSTFTPEELIALVGPIRTLPQIVLTDDNGDKYHVGGYKDLVDHLMTGAKVLRKLG